MRHRLLAAGLLMVLLSPARAEAQAVLLITDEDRRQFEELFVGKLAAAQQSRDKADDVLLAAEMADFADSIPDSPGVQRLIYAELIPLSAGAGDSAGALDAAHKLRALSPDDPAVSDEALLSLCDRAYREAARADRPAVAEPYLALLIEMAGHAEAERDIARALELCRQASSIARTVDSPRRDSIDQMLGRITELNAIESRITMLQQSVRNNPRNAAAARELAQMLMIHHDSPSEAAEFAPLSGDADLADVVAMSIDGPDLARAPEALRVGDWYFALADQNRADDALAEPLLLRARAWYARFLETYPRQDALAARVRGMDSVAQGRLERIAQARREAMRGQWINLLAEGFDPEQHMLGDNYALRGGKLYTDRTGFVLPNIPRGDFQLRLRFTLQEGNEGLTIHLPVGESAATVRYSWFGLRMSMIDSVNVRDNADPRKLRPGVEVELMLLATSQPGGRVTVAMLVNGEASMRWQGPAGELEPSDNHAPPAEMGRAVRVTCPGRYVFHNIELRERVGD